MRLKNKSTLIITAILTIGLNCSRGWSQAIIKTNDGVLISFPVMDSISVKLIERESLITQNETLNNVVILSEKQNETLKSKIEIYKNDNINLLLINEVSEKQKSELLRTLKLKDGIIKARKKKSFKNSVFCGLGGFLLASIMFIE